MPPTAQGSQLDPRHHMQPTDPEPYRSPKEVQQLMDAQGICYSVAYWRAAMKVCPSTIKGGRFVRLSELWAWWSANPNWKPWGRS